MTTDPVCRMEVDERTAPAHAEYQGTTYWFCSEPCKLEFLQDPEGILARAA